MKSWKPDTRYTDIYFAQANNELEYIQLIKDLFAEHEIICGFSCDQWKTKEHLFNDDVLLWHELFMSECLYDDKYENEELPLPQNYEGNIEEKPEQDEYPLVVIFCNSESMRMITWYSL